MFQFVTFYDFSYIGIIVHSIIKQFNMHVSIFSFVYLPYLGLNHTDHYILV